MTTTTRILTVAGLLGAIGLGGTAYLQGQSQRADAATTAVVTEEATPVPAMHVRHHGDKLDEAAKLFGITTDELRKEMESGKPFYQIAAEHGVTYDKLREQRKADLKTRLDDMVKVGFMTQEQADEILANTDDMPVPFFDGPHGFGMMKMMP